MESSCLHTAELKLLISVYKSILIFHELDTNENCMKTEISCDKILPPVGIELGPLITSDSKSSSLLSKLMRHVLLKRSSVHAPLDFWT